MREVIFVFRSRSQAASFFEQTHTYLLPSKLINTPKEALLGCGLSVKMLYKNFQRAKIILSRGDYSSFAGAFAILKNGMLEKLDT